MGLNIYDNTIVIGVFILMSIKMRVYDKLDVFRYTLNLTNLIKSDTCYPNNHASRIDLFLTNLFSFRTLVLLKQLLAIIIDRSSHQRCSMKKGVLRNFAKLTGKHLYQSLFFNKVAGLRHRCEFYEISKNTFFTEHLWRTASTWTNYNFKVVISLIFRD